MIKKKEEPNMKKWLSVLLSLCLLLSVCPALAELEPDVQITGTPETYANTDLSKEYTVYMYLIGDKPNDWAQIEELANEYLKPFNTRLSTQFMSWSDGNSQNPRTIQPSADMNVTANFLDLSKI